MILEELYQPLGLLNEFDGSVKHQNSRQAVGIAVTQRIIAQGRRNRSGSITGLIRVESLFPFGCQWRLAAFLRVELARAARTPPDTVEIVRIKSLCRWRCRRSSAAAKSCSAALPQCERWEEDQGQQNQTEARKSIAHFPTPHC